MAQHDKAELGVLVQRVATRRRRGYVFRDEVPVGEQQFEVATDHLATARPGVGLQRVAAIMAERIERIRHLMFSLSVP